MSDYGYWNDHRGMPSDCLNTQTAAVWQQLAPAFDAFPVIDANALKTHKSFLCRESLTDQASVGNHKALQVLVTVVGIWDKSMITTINEHRISASCILVGRQSLMHHRRAAWHRIKDINPGILTISDLLAQLEKTNIGKTCRTSFAKGKTPARWFHV